MSVPSLNRIQGLAIVYTGSYKDKWPKVDFVFGGYSRCL